MKTDTELEVLLRSTLADRADTIHDARSWAASAPAPSRPRRRWLLALAAATAVVLVAAGVLLGVHYSRSSQPSHHTPSPTPPVIPTVCQTSLPAAWRDALQRSVIDVGGAANPLSVAADGTLVAFRDDGVHHGDPRDVVLVRPGQAPQVVYHVPNPDQLYVQNAYLDGKWLVVATSLHPRPPKGVVPGDSPMPNVRHLLVIDLTNGEQRTIAQTTSADETSGGRSIQSATLLDGRVYWDVKARYAGTTGVIKAYSLRTGTTSTVYSGPLGFVVGGAAGIVSDSRVVVFAEMPSIVRAATNSKTVVTAGSDGTNWAWLADKRTLGYWRPGNPQPTYLRLPKPEESIYWPGTVTVSGRFVFMDGYYAIDVATGAEATVSGEGVLRGGEAWAVAMYTNGQYAAGYAPTGLLVLNTSQLPALTC